MPISQRMDKKKDRNIMVRVSADLHEQFKAILKANDNNQSEIIRELIKKYVAENKQKTLF